MTSRSSEVSTELTKFDAWFEAILRYFDALDAPCPEVTQDDIHRVVHIFLHNARLKAVNSLRNIRMQSMLLFAEGSGMANPWEDAVVAAQKVVDFIDIFCLQKSKARPQQISCVALAALDKLQASRDNIAWLASISKTEKDFFRRNADHAYRAKLMVQAVLAERCNDFYLRDLCIAKSEDRCQTEVHFRMYSNTALNTLCEKFLSRHAARPANFITAVKVCKRLNMIIQLDDSSKTKLSNLLAAYERCLPLAEEKLSGHQVWQADILIQAVLLYPKYGDVLALSHSELMLEVVECAYNSARSTQVELPVHVVALVTNLWATYFSTWSASDNTVPECVRCADSVAKELGALHKLQAVCGRQLQDDDVQQHRFGIALWKYVGDMTRERTLATFVAANEILKDEQWRWGYVVHANAVVSQWQEVALFVQKCHLRVQHCTEQLASQRPLVCLEVNECLEAAFQCALRHAQSVLTEAETRIFVHGEYVLPDMESLSDQNRRAFDLVKEHICFAQNLQSEAAEYFHKMSTAQSANASQALPHLNIIYTELVVYGQSHLDAIQNGAGIIWDVHATSRRRNSFAEAYKAVEYLLRARRTKDPDGVACWRSASEQRVLSLRAVDRRDKEHHNANMSVFSDCAMALFDKKLSDPAMRHIRLAKQFAERVIEGNLTEKEKKYVNLARDSNFAAHQGLKFRYEDVWYTTFRAECHTALADWSSCEEDEDFFVVKYVAYVHDDQLFMMARGFDERAPLWKSWLHTIIQLLLAPTTHSAFCNILEFEGQVELSPELVEEATSFAESVRILCGARVIASRANDHDWRMKELFTLLERLVNAYQYVIVEYVRTADIHQNLGLDLIDTAEFRKHVGYSQKAIIAHVEGDEALSECYQTAASQEIDDERGEGGGWCFEVILAHEQGDTILTELLFAVVRALRACTYAKHGQSVNALKMVHAAAQERVYIHRATLSGNEAARDLHMQALAAFDGAHTKFITAQRTKNDAKSRNDAKRLWREGEKLSEQARRCLLVNQKSVSV